MYLAHEDVPVAVIFSSCNPQGYILVAVARIRILTYNRSQEPRSNNNLVAGKPRATLLSAGEGASPKEHPNAPLEAPRPRPAFRQMFGPCPRGWMRSRCNLKRLSGAYVNGEYTGILALVSACKDVLPGAIYDQ